MLWLARAIAGGYEWCKGRRDESTALVFYGLDEFLGGKELL